MNGEIILEEPQKGVYENFTVDLKDKMLKNRPTNFRIIHTRQVTGKQQLCK